MRTPINYSIRVEGYLDHTWVEWFDGLTISHEPNGDSVLYGSVRDQAALYGLLNRLGDLGLALIAVSSEPQQPCAERGDSND